MLIDWHVHIHDIKDQVNPYWKGRCPMTPENALELAVLEVDVTAKSTEGWLSVRSPVGSRRRKAVSSGHVEDTGNRKL